MKIQLVRHATLYLEVKGLKIGVDPMLSPAGALDPVDHAENNRRNPLVDLPSNIPDFEGLDAVIVTHTHRDHFDSAAAQLLPKQSPVFCQPEDERKISELGFRNVHSVYDTEIWNGMRLTRTKGRHGKGDLAKKMGPVSGFILQTEEESALYIVGDIVGDSVWCPEVEEALIRYKLEVTIVNAGAAQFLTGGPITMTGWDIEQVFRKIPETHVITVHMEAWNHCLLTRRELRQYLEEQGISHRVHIPDDGEWMDIP